MALYRKAILRHSLPALLALGGALAAQDSWSPQRRAAGQEPRAGKAGSGRGAIGIDLETRSRIDRALEFLYRSQNPDGSWTDRVGRKVHTTYRGTVAPHVGVTALAGMAFLAGGTLPDQGSRERYCLAVRKALDYVMDHTGADGFVSDNGSRMYSHAFATLFLAEAHGTTLHPDSKRIHDSLKRAVRLIVQSQNDLGGWRYLPGAPDADMSISVCQVMALRAARNAGIQVPKETIQSAVGYVKRSFMSYGTGLGVFKYQIEPDVSIRHRYSWALTACGVTALYGAGEYSAQEVREGLRYLWSYMPPLELARNRFDYFYGHYYAVQAAFQAGGEYWTRWYETVKDDLLELQAPDGSWADLVGSNYATAMAAIILQMPNQYLPITEN
ncbi:MAG: prenyltransferase [Planctomycetes bacterium]|nr:prenyltransferase [Planctomycetota bacterium]